MVDSNCLFDIGKDFVAVSNSVVERLREPDLLHMIVLSSSFQVSCDLTESERANPLPLSISTSEKVKRRHLALDTATSNMRRNHYKRDDELLAASLSETTAN